MERNLSAQHSVHGSADVRKGRDSPRKALQCSPWPPDARILLLTQALPASCHTPFTPPRTAQTCEFARLFLVNILTPSEWISSLMRFFLFFIRRSLRLRGTGFCSLLYREYSTMSNTVKYVY